MVAEKTKGDIEQIAYLFTNEEEFATPKIDVCGAVICDDKSLLVREIADEGRWMLSGGWTDIGDSPKTAVVQEVFEESDFETKVTKLIAMLDRDRHPHSKMFTHL